MPSDRHVGQRAIKHILAARSPSEIARCFIFPMPTQIGQHLHIYTTAQELADGYAQLAQAKAQKGLTLFHSRIVAIELPRNNRFRVWIDWLYTDQDGNPATGDRSIYFCSTLRGHAAVEMIQCQPPSNPQQPARKKTYALA